jgi:hypothetical protein
METTTNDDSRIDRRVTHRDGNRRQYTPRRTIALIRATAVILKCIGEGYLTRKGA